MKIRILTLLVLLFCLGPALRAQDGKVSWSTEAVQVEDSIYELVFSGKPEAGWHTYGCAAEYSAPEISFGRLKDCEAVGGLYDITKPVQQDGDPP